MFGSILPISLQQIEYEKIHAVHSNELAKIYTQIFGGRYCETRRLFTSCLFYSLPYSLLCKCIEFSLPTILPPYSEQENLTKYSLSSQVLMFGSILPISLQQFEYDKIHVVHSNELAWDSSIIVVKNGRYSQNVGKISNNKKKVDFFIPKLDRSWLVQKAILKNSIFFWKIDEFWQFFNF